MTTEETADGAVQASLTGEVETRLVNVTEYGRTGVRMIGRSTDFGNPFKIEKDGGEYTRRGCVEAFEDWWYADEQADLRQRARDELRGEILGCYCLGEGEKYDPGAVLTEVQGDPSVCHGEVILEFLDEGDE